MPHGLRVHKDPPYNCRPRPVGPGECRPRRVGPGEAPGGELTMTDPPAVGKRDPQCAPHNAPLVTHVSPRVTCDALRYPPPRPRVACRAQTLARLRRSPGCVSINSSAPPRLP